MEHTDTITSSPDQPVNTLPPDKILNFLNSLLKLQPNEMNSMISMVCDDRNLEKSLQNLIYSDFKRLLCTFIINNLGKSHEDPSYLEFKEIISKHFDRNAHLREFSSYNDIEKNVINIFNNVYNRDFNVNNEIDNLHTNIKKLQTENGEKLSNMHNNADNIKIEDKYSKIEV